jgi:hypothetical protein
MMNPTMTVSALPTSSGDRLLTMAKSLYQADHQTKFFDLQADAETLLQQLQSLKQQRLAGQADHSHN